MVTHPKHEAEDADHGIAALQTHFVEQEAETSHHGTTEPLAGISGQIIDNMEFTKFGSNYSNVIKTKNNTMTIDLLSIKLIDVLSPGDTTYVILTLYHIDSTQFRLDTRTQ